MADTVRCIWQSIVNSKRTYLNPHEHFGRANIFRAALGSWLTVYLLFKWNSARKVKILKAEKVAHNPKVHVHHA